MYRGWVGIYRKLQCHWLWDDKPFSKGQAWIDLLLLANHGDKKVLLGNEIVEVKTGSFITSELKLMERWGWSKTKVRSFLKLLESDGMIVKKSDRKKTVISIEKYSDYSVYETTERPPRDHKETTERLREDTNNNDNNDNNVNNENIIGDSSESTPPPSKKRFIKPSLEEVEAYCRERGNSVNAQRFIDHYESNGWKVGKNSMKDWKAAVRTWENRERGNSNAGIKRNITGDEYTGGSYKIELI